MPVSDKMVVQGGSVVKNIVISMQNTLLSEAVARTLAETREFRVEQILPGHADDTLSLCETVRADILLMEVSRLNAYTLESRLSLIDRVRRKIKACKFVLLCDENSDMELAHRVMHARQDRLIDAFLYSSVTPHVSGCRAGCVVRKKRKKNRRGAWSVSSPKISGMEE